MPTTNPTRPYSIPGFRIALVREPGVKLAERPQIRVPAEAAPMLAQYIGEADREVFVIAMLSIRHRVLGLHTVSVGCLTSSLVHPREVFKPAILSGSAALLVCHNHPSGDAEPSAEDISLTRRLAAAGQLLGIELIDHLILGEADREVFVIAMLSIRHRVLGLHTVSVGCLTSSLVHPRLCAAPHKRGYVAAVVM